MPALFRKSRKRKEAAFEKQAEGALVIRFRTNRSANKLTFNEEESAGIKAMILDILTEAYKKGLQRDSPYDKAG